MGASAFMLVTLVSAAAAAAGAPDPGQGTAYAQAWKVDPREAGLSIGISFGQSTSTHTNTIGKSVSTATNMGVIGLTLASQQCNGNDATWPREAQPQPLVVDSRDDGAAAGVSSNTNGGTDAVPLFSRYGQATKAPFTKAVTTISPFTIPGIDMGSGISTTWSGLLNGQREAGATVELQYLNLGGTVAGTAVHMSNLRWDAVYRSTGDKKVEGHFTIGSGSGGGQSFSGKQDPTTLDSINSTLASVGLKLVPGTVHNDNGILTVDPLALVVYPNTTRDQAAGQVVGGAQDSRGKFFDAYNKGDGNGHTGDCRIYPPLSVGDIVVGSLTGAGEFVLSLGGVQATSGVTPHNDFNLDLGNFGTIGDVDIPGEPTIQSLFLGTSDTVSGPVTVITTTPGTPATPTVQLAAPAGHTTPIPRPFEGTRGGALATVGFVTLAVLGAVAESDRRKLRRTQLPRTTEVAG